MKKYKRTFKKILGSSLFRLDGPEINLTDLLTDLGNQIRERCEKNKEVDWSLGEFVDCDLVSLIIGAYWALTEWHGGQYSTTYAAMCSLGRVWSPGMTAGPEPDSSEEFAYQVVCKYYERINTPT